MAKKIESIKIMKSSDLTPEARNELKLKDSGFVELRVERESPPETKIIQLNVSPLKRIRDVFKEEGVLK